jgi:hypothetical protein
MATNGQISSRARTTSENEVQTAQTAAFTQHLIRASMIVQRWPTWKQQLLGRTAAQSAASGASDASCKD